jgi:hypothetical protein
MILYSKADIIELFCAKYGIESKNEKDIQEKILELDNKKNNMLNKMKEKRTNKHLNRKNMLIKELNNYGLELRDDSNLCKLYIEGRAEKEGWTLDKIIKRLCEVRYLFDYCHISEYFEEAKQNQREEIEAGYFPDCSLFDEAEYLALMNTSSKKYPDRWPWL